MSDDNALHEKPLEFLTLNASDGKWHDAQAVLPEGDHYVAWCTCEEWRVEVPDRDTGLHLARIHTGSIPEDAPMTPTPSLVDASTSIATDQ